MREKEGEREVRESSEREGQRECQGGNLQVERRLNACD